MRMDRELRTLGVGKGEALLEGDDVLILAIGSTVYPSVEAAQGLLKGRYWDFGDKLSIPKAPGWGIDLHHG